MANKHIPTKAEYREEAVHQALLDWLDDHVGRSPTNTESNELRKYLARVHRFAGESWEMFVGPGNVRVLAEHYRTVDTTENGGTP